MAMKMLYFAIVEHFAGLEYNNLIKLVGAASSRDGLDLTSRIIAPLRHKDTKIIFNQKIPFVP